MSLTHWLARNGIIIDFVYGLSFFSLGLVVITQHGSLSRYRLAKRLRSLAAFSLFHAFADWGRVFMPLMSGADRFPVLAMLAGLKTMLVAISFGFLMHFGLGLLRESQKPLQRLIPMYLAPVLTLGWFSAFFLYPLFQDQATVSQWYWVSEAWSRYLLGLPAGLITAYGLLDQIGDLRRDGLQAQIPNVCYSAAFFTIYSLTSGLVVPRQSFWPASMLNSDTFLQVAGVPIELVRTLIVIGISVFTVRLLGIFHTETTRRVIQSEEESAVLRERERIARELHDGILQTLYGVGLGLRRTQNQLPPNADTLKPELEELTSQLGGAITDLRQSITNLRDDILPLAEVVPAARECIRQISRLSRLTIDMETEGFDEQAALQPVPVSYRDHVVSLLREGLSNVVRHAECQDAKVLLALQEDTIILRVEDEGRGFSPAIYLTGKDEKTSGHHGLRNLSYRTKHLGGTLRIDSSPGKGTRLLFQIPLPILPGKEDSEQHVDKPSHRS